MVNHGLTANLTTAAPAKLRGVILTQSAPIGIDVNPKVVVKAVPPPAVLAALISLRGASIDLTFEITTVLSFCGIHSFLNVFHH